MISSSPDRPPGLVKRRLDGGSSASIQTKFGKIDAPTKKLGRQRMNEVNASALSITHEKWPSGFREK
jgi:hypothetical protein